MDISTRCGVWTSMRTAAMATGSQARPYPGKRLWLYKHQGRHGWKRSYLSDDDNITSVNARWDGADAGGFSRARK